MPNYITLANPRPASLETGAVGGEPVVPQLRPLGENSWMWEWFEIT